MFKFELSKIQNHVIYKSHLISYFFIISISVWNECWGSSMDRAERSSTKRWFPQCHDSLCWNAISGAVMLYFSSYIYPCSCLAQEESDQKKLVTQQEIVPQKNSWSSRKRRVSENMIKVLICQIFCCFHYYRQTHRQCRTLMFWSLHRLLLLANLVFGWCC